MTGQTDLLAYARPFRAQLTRLALVQVGAALTTLALPWLAGSLLGGVVEARLDSMGALVGALAGFLVASTALRIVGAVTSVRIGAQILARLRADAYDHLQRLPLPFSESRREGELLSLLTFETGRLSDFLAVTLASLPATIVSAAGATVLLFVLDPLLALVVPIVVPVFYIGMRLMGRKLRAAATRMRDAESAVIAAAQSHLAMLPATKAFAVEERQSAAYRTLLDRARANLVAIDGAYAAIGPLVGLLAALAALAVIVLAGFGIGGPGQRSPGELFAILLYAALLTRPVAALSEFYGRWQMARGALAQLGALLEEKPEPGYAAIPDFSDRASIPGGPIIIENLHFAYPGRPAVFTGADCRIEAGETVALVGRNGAGKSTLAKLLLRFHVPDAGRIAIGGVEIADRPVQALRRSIGYVPQRALLFDGTVRDNIAFGLPDADDAELHRVIALAHAGEFIAALPDGLETAIGDGGVRLSGGQRQRLALARALLADPPILILDEATAMFDRASEAAFVGTCRNAFAGRTVILITHRPAALALADRVLRVENGLIVPVN